MPVRCRFSGAHSSIVVPSIVSNHLASHSYSLLLLLLLLVCVYIVFCASRCFSSRELPILMHERSNFSEITHSIWPQSGRCVMEFDQTKFIKLIWTEYIYHRICFVSFLSISRIISSEWVECVSE